MRKTEPKTKQKLAPGTNSLPRTSLSTGFLRRYVFPNSYAAQCDVPTSPPPSERERERREREREKREKREKRERRERRDRRDRRDRREIRER